MHLQENTLYIFDLWGSRSHEMLPSSLYFMRHNHVQSLKLLRLMVYEEMHLQENTLLAQYPLHHVTYLGTKFEVARSNDLGGDTFTRNVTDRRKDNEPTLVRNLYTLFF